MLDFYEASYIAYNLKLDSDEFWSLIASNKINLPKKW